MARFSILTVSLITLLVFTSLGFSFAIQFSDAHVDFDYKVSKLLLFHQDNSPPAPPHPPSVTCEEDLGGVGSLDTVCKIVSHLNIARSVYIAGKGSFYILPNVKVNCLFSGCEIQLNVSGNFALGENSSIVAGSFQLSAYNASFGKGSVVNTTGLAGNPPPQTSGTPEGLDGAGGGYGGRGAICLMDQQKHPEPRDVWGGDAYGWSSLESPCCYGSKGGRSNMDEEDGGGGGGIIKMSIVNLLELNASLLADGGDGGLKGGGGSGGSIYVRAQKMIGSGKISVHGGDGFAGGGGGRVAVDVPSRYEEPEIFAYGGSSRGCQENAGAAGTFFDAVTHSLTINNHNKSANTETVLLDFPWPFLTNVYINNRAKASVPLLWSRVQVQGQIKLEAGGEMSFGLRYYSISEFELLAEELLMSDSVIKAFGALRVSVKQFQMWNSKMLVAS